MGIKKGSTYARASVDEKLSDEKLVKIFNLKDL